LDCCSKFHPERLTLRRYTVSVDNLDEIESNSDDEEYASSVEDEDDIPLEPVDPKQTGFGKHCSNSFLL